MFHYPRADRVYSRTTVSDLQEITTEWPTPQGIEDGMGLTNSQERQQVQILKLLSSELDIGAM